MTDPSPVEIAKRVMRDDVDLVTNAEIRALCQRLLECERELQELRTKEPK